MYFGACYYPEHWPEGRWETDAILMRDAGFNVIRMSEFAWTKIEKEEGSYDFAWLERAVGLFARYGMKSILGTPTAAPPKWLIDKHPDICPVDYEGRVMRFGHRRYYCFNNSTYHGYVKRIVEAMADKFAQNENVIAVQVDNEFGCGGTTRCYCENCLSEFTSWLKKKYRSIKELNENWGTVFSNQTYTNWDELNLPGFCAFNIHNPGLALDYRRFASDSVVAFQKLQVEILRKKMPGKVITHNTMGGFGEIDYFELAKDLDVVSLDIYPNATRSEPINPENPAIQLDATRGIKGINFWVMEHQSGAPGGGVMFTTPRPGDLKKWTYQSIARGADAIIYFRFRTCLFGAEEYWHGILDHSGVPGRRYEEVRQVGRELALVSGLIENSTSSSKVAMIRSFDNAWAFEIQPHTTSFKYNIHFKGYYSYFFKNNIPVDIISTDCGLSDYRVIVAPSLMMAKEDFVQRLYAYVQSGGIIILDFRAGAKEWNNRMTPAILPGMYREILGVEIDEYGTIPEKRNIMLRQLGDQSQYTGHTWYDVISLYGAEALVEYASDYFCGKPAITRNGYGLGTAYYIGTEIDNELMKYLFDDICRKAEVYPLLGITDKGVELFQRTIYGKVYYFIINHNLQKKIVHTKGSFVDIISRREFLNDIELEANEVLVLEET